MRGRHRPAILGFLAVLLASPCVGQEVGSSSSAGDLLSLPAMAPAMWISESQSNLPVPEPARLQIHPYLYGGLAMSHGAGYAPSAGIAGSGAEFSRRRLLLFTEASVQDAHKLDSGTGTELAAQMRGFLRVRAGWYFGGGAQWSRLNTSAYVKQAWRPAFGAGRELTHENFSMRAQALYVLPGTDHLNGVQGTEFSLWLPSPSSPSHLVCRQTIGLYEFHQTSVPGNPGTGQRSVAALMTVTAMYRF